MPKKPVVKRFVGDYRGEVCICEGCGVRLPKSDAVIAEISQYAIKGGPWKSYKRPYPQEYWCEECAREKWE